MLRIGSTLTLAIVAAACAAATRGPGSARCMPGTIDPAWTAAGPVYRGCEVDRVARRDNPDLRPDFVPTQACETAVLEFVVDASGSPEPGTAHQVRGNSTALAQALIASLPRWRYDPALKGGVPVRQVVQEGIATVMVREATGAPRQPRVSRQTSCIP